MNDKDKKQFAGIIKVLAVNAGIEFTKDIARFYFQSLKNYSIEQIEEGCKGVLLTWEQRRMPPMAILVKHIDGEVQPVEDRALVMANQIVSHLNQWGGSKHPDLNGDPIAIELMSRRWNYKAWASNVIESELHWWVKEFCEAYRAYSESDMTLIEAPAEVRALVSGIGGEAT